MYKPFYVTNYTRMSKPFYITTTLPYVNAKPHIGFALEIVFADILARYHKEQGDVVFFNTGTDEHGQKLYDNAMQAGLSPQEYVDGFASKFRELIPRLGILPDVHFIRTTDEHHVRAAQEFWKRCFNAGDIYKKTYQVKYCVGCELEKTDSELVDGFCPLHPGKEIQLIDEENYFFRFSRFQKQLLELYDREGHDFVVPKTRLHEIREFVSAGLKDFSISRVKEKMPWGIPVPDDDKQVMYVWFDALINYISTLGWPQGNAEFKMQNAELNTVSDNSAFSIQDSAFTKFWPGVQIAGKDNLRQQSAMWQAMLLSADLPTSKQILIHGFITSGGQKMSKTIGNVVDPFEVIDKLIAQGVAEAQAIDALRYWFAREMPTFEDGDFTWEKFVESYTANLANGIGNLTSRVLKMAVNAGIVGSGQWTVDRFDSEFAGYLENYEIQKAADWVWAKIKAADEFIAKEEPFKKIKVDAEGGKRDIEHLLQELATVAYHLQPLLPDTAARVMAALQDVGSENIPRLFPRIE